MAKDNLVSKKKQEGAQAVRIYRPLAEAVVMCLMRIFNDGTKADKVIESVLKSNPKWGSRDRGFIAENTYEIVRWWRLLKFCGGPGCIKLESKEDFFLISGVWYTLKGIELPDWSEFRNINKKDVLEKYKEAQQTRKIKESVPDWLDELGEKELGEHWNAELAAMNHKAEVYLRANTLKTEVGKLAGLLGQRGVETTRVEGCSDALKLKERSNVFGLPEFKEGLFEVQDAGSQIITDFLDVEPGQRVVDACAGAGGKSLHIAAKLKNKGKLIAMDVEEYKLAELKKRARRNGVDTIETRLIESKTIKRMHNSADRLLLDVPCSGLGVLKRNPDSKWKLKPEFIEEIRKVQEEILFDYSKILRAGGKMVYATCSILPSEGERHVRKFLRKNKAFELLEEKRVSPARDGFDGFYMALIQKKKVEEALPPSA